MKRGGQLMPSPETTNMMIERNQPRSDGNKNMFKITSYIDEPDTFKNYKDGTDINTYHYDKKLEEYYTLDKRMLKNAFGLKNRKNYVTKELPNPNQPSTQGGKRRTRRRRRRSNKKRTNKRKKTKTRMKRRKTTKRKTNKRRRKR